MSDYRHGSHTTFAIHLHIVWITQYRHKVLRGEVAERVRAIVREACRKSGVDIMKGKSSYRLLAEFPQMRKRFWGRHVWARGPFCGSSGNVTDEVIKASMAQQSHDSDDVFRIEGEASPSGDTPLGDSSGEEPRPRLEPA
jgi:REP-associated tyrosine transposase